MTDAEPPDPLPDDDGAFLDVVMAAGGISGKPTYEQFYEALRRWEAGLKSLDRFPVPD
jgi:hypothetical protein